MTPSRLTKLKAMAPGEIAHRVAYEALTAVERRAHARGTLAPPDRLRRALVPELRRSRDWAVLLVGRPLASRFFAWEDDPAGVRRWFSGTRTGELARARAIASATARHEIGFFGQTFRFGPEIDWHADPVTGAAWPRRYHRDVPVHGGNVGFGDVKHVWELNRHQFFVDLAKVAFLDRTHEPANDLFALLASWQAAVPYATGAPWACALEPAFRAWSWIWAYRLLHQAGMLPDRVHVEWLAGFYDHARFLYRHLETYSSPYNHLTGEAAALFALGLLFPEFDKADAWTARGRSVLESTVGAQFHEDGGTVEQSTFYHHATLGFYILSALLAERNGAPLDRSVLDAIERGVEFSMSLAQPDGRVPSIGGADDGKPIRLEHLPFWDFRPYQAIGAVMFSRPDFKAAAGRFFEDALWVLGCEGAMAFDRIAAGPPASVCALPSSGYYVARSGWSVDADYLCFDCGEQAAGLHRNDVPSAAHGHADCLSVIVHLGGRPVLVDPGFFCYNGDPEWEVQFRKTAAHNTLAIDGRDQARHVSKMAWTHTYAARREGWTPAAGIAWARGSHDGFARGSDGVVHRRTAWLRSAGYVIIYDEIEGTGEHTVQAHYQFAPGVLEQDGDSAVLFDGRFELAWTATSPVAAAISCGGPHPSGGWVARSLGVREPAPHLTLTLSFAAPRTALLAIVADRRHDRAGRSTRRTEALLQEASILAARVLNRDGEDRLVAGGGSRVRACGFETDAPLAVARIAAGAVEHMAGTGGTYLRVSPAPWTGADERRAFAEVDCAG